MLPLSCRTPPYGPETSEIVIVEVYVPDLADPGTARVNVGVTVWAPRPVPAAASYSFVAVGAVVAEGSV
jgi:hypothetical protein